MITFYDLAARPPITTWSSNPWKVRYLLNFKKLPYKTVYVEFPDITSTSKSLGIPPSQTKLDGATPLYTIPAIIDDATGVALSDSYKIAEYFDKQYPDTPKAIPPGSEALHASFYAYFAQLIAVVGPLLVPKIPAILNTSSVEYYISTRREFLGKPFAEIGLVGEAYAESWDKVKTNIGKIDGWLSKGPGPFFMGETPVFADFVVAGIFQLIRVTCGESSEEWNGVLEWHGGRWGNLLKNLERYEGAD